MFDPDAGAGAVAPKEKGFAAAAAGDGADAGAPNEIGFAAVAAGEGAGAAPPNENGFGVGWEVALDEDAGGETLAGSSPVSPALSSPSSSDSIFSARTAYSFMNWE